MHDPSITKWSVFPGTVTPNNNAKSNIYRIVDYFLGVLIFVIFVISLQVTKISTTSFSTHVIGASTRLNHDEN